MHKKKLILHVGCAKTGTKSIQNALSNSREVLAENGILYPKSPGNANHLRLVVAAQNDNVIHNVKKNVLSEMGLGIDDFRAQLKKKIQHELGSNETWHTLVLSTELVHCFLNTPDEIMRLFSLFENYVSEIKVVLFLRRQDELALSRFSSALRNGHANFDDVFGNVGACAYQYLPVDRQINDFEDYYDFKKLIERFKPHVEYQNIKIAIYSGCPDAPNSLENFATLSGISLDLITSDAANLNVAMSAQSQYVMSKVNQSLDLFLPSGAYNKEAKKLHRAIEKEVPGEKRYVCRADAESFVKQFEDSNEWVRDKFFPEQQSLFSLDFSSHPEKIDYSHFQQQLAGEVKTFVEKAISLPSKEPFVERLKRFKRLLRNVLN